MAREHLYAGLSAYLLAGIFFGVFSWDLERTWPGSLAVRIARLVSLYPSGEDKGTQRHVHDGPGSAP